MRSPEEIIKYIEISKNMLWFQLIKLDCVSCLPYKYAAAYLPEEITADDWDAIYKKNDEEIINEIVSYLPKAWEYIEREQFVKTLQSMYHFRTWFFCLGDVVMYERVKSWMRDEYLSTDKLGARIIKEIEKWLRDNGHLKGE